VLVQADTFGESAARMIGGAVMGETTQEDALHQAAALVDEALRKTEARCGLLGQYINDCDSKGSRTAAWNGALSELRALHERRTQLMRRRSLIQQALECPVGELPATVQLQPPRDRTALRSQRQVQIRPRRRS
jgi:hypothetical protein